MFGFPNVGRASTRRFRVPALIVGSGFGGAVSALRLGAAGIRTAVVERGRRWDVIPGQPGPFGEILNADGTPTFDKRLGWRATNYDVPGVPSFPIEQYTGVLEVLDGDGMSVLNGAGVGGGSLVYGATLAQPSRAAFERVMPGSVNYDEMDRYFYPIARRVLGSKQVFSELRRINDLAGGGLLPFYQAMLSAKEEAEAVVAANPGRLRRVLLDAGVNFDLVLNELVRLTTEGVSPSFLVGNYSISGANSGAKNSLDRNYLRYAESTGKVSVHPLCEVDYFERDGNGYRVYINKLDDAGNPIESVIVECRALILGAGSTGTTKLLLKSKREGLDLPDAVGQRWGTNGDVLGGRFNLGSLGSVPGVFGLPVIGGPPMVMVEDKGNPVLGPASIEYAGGLGSMQTLGQAVAGAGAGSLALGSGDGVIPQWPLLAQLGVLGAVQSTHALINDLPPVPSCGEPRFNAPQINPNAPGCLAIPPDPSCVPLPTPEEAAALAGCAARPSTYHPLGGAVMGEVCDDTGEVFGADNLFVMDGALIPGSAGAVNPALTIAALAERNVRRALRRRRWTRAMAGERADSIDL